MKDEKFHWFDYAEENLTIARLALEGGYYNACLQNVQQAVEKYLKASLLQQNEGFSRTHSIEALNQQLLSLGIDVGLSEEDCELLDAIYIPSKYPLGNALPNFSPDKELGEQCLEIGNRVEMAVQMILNRRERR